MVNALESSALRLDAVRDLRRDNAPAANQRLRIAFYLDVIFRVNNALEFFTRQFAEFIYAIAFEDF